MPRLAGQQPEYLGNQLRASSSHDGGRKSGRRPSHNMKTAVETIFVGKQRLYNRRFFNERRRTNPIMFNVAHVLNPPMITALAAHFKDLDAKPLGGAPKELVATGKTLYEEGVPDANVPPCSSCHGPEGKGDGAFPRLAGQLHDYIFRKLVNWSKERGQDRSKPDTSAIMEPIAHSLTEPQIEAVAAYVSYLE